MKLHALLLGVPESTGRTAGVGRLNQEHHHLIPATVRCPRNLRNLRIDISGPPVITF
jgi:hypothetical protein